MWLPPYLRAGMCGLLMAVAVSGTSEPLIDRDTVQRYNRFTTWQGIEPDKWASLWLIKRYIAPDAYFLLVPPGQALPPNALPFGIPEARIRRANRVSMFNRLAQAMQVNTPAIRYVDQIIHDIEVNIWDGPQHPHTPWFEAAYRALQARYQRDQVPVDCYLAFFDGVARLAIQGDVGIHHYRDRLGLGTLCPGISQPGEGMVESLGHVAVLREISLGKRVVFVDTREHEEYDGVHLPGARLLRLRDVNQKSADALMEADLVIPYCVKDFRGFEVAKLLRQHGLKRVATLSPNGLKGWLAAGLPVAGRDGGSEQQALEQLMQCAMAPLQCGIAVTDEVFL